MSKLLASCIFQSKTLRQGEFENVWRPNYGFLSRVLKAPPSTTAVAFLGDREEGSPFWEEWLYCVTRRLP